MKKKYLATAHKRVQDAEIPKHPLITRCWELPDGKLVVADTSDDVELDKEDLRNCPTFQDYLKANRKPPVIGSLQSGTFLSASAFGAQFMTAFAHAGEVDQAAAAALAAEKAAKETPVVETPKTE